jgi:hypothetical protein
MTLDEFLKLLKQVAKKTPFHMTKSGEIRTRSNKFCPLTAACYYQTRNCYPTDKWALAARDLRINHYDAEGIMLAADFEDATDQQTRLALEDLCK